MIRLPTLFPPSESGLRQRSEFWYETRDGDPVAMALYRRHYSCHHYRDGRPRRLFVGPGEKMVLVAPEGNALFVWRKFISGDGQSGINCSAFRNEGAGLSSLLILDAMALAWDRWPGERLYTYVNPRAIESRNPGYCFKMAGWRRTGVTKWNRLIILEAFPAKGEAS